MSGTPGGPRGPEPEEPDTGSHGSDAPRRSRRAGRSGGANDFRRRFGGTADRETPASREPRGDGGLQEPRSADRYVRGRTRLTVRELLEQMDAEGTAPTPPEPRGRTRPGPSVPPAPRTPAPTPPPTAQPPETLRGTRSRRPDGPAPDDSPTTVNPVIGRDDLTQRIPVVGDRPVVPPAPGDLPVDISERATRDRVVAESRGQTPYPAQPQDIVRSRRATESPGPDESETTTAPALEPTPDLSGRLPRLSPARRRRRTRRETFTRDATVTGRILVTIACVLALVGTGFVWGLQRYWDGSWNQVAAVDPDDENVRNRDAQHGDETYLIVGTDTRGGQNSKVGAGTTADAEGARADTIILVSVPADRSRAVAVSFPRDLQVDRPECQMWDNETGTYGDTLYAADGVKLNSVYGDGGPQCLRKVITQMSGLNINRFIAMDFYGFEKVVRALGGVEVCSPTPLYDYELGQILKKSGKQTLTGSRALDYVRARMVASEGNGDYGRIKRQQLFLSSLLRSSLSGDVLSNPSKLNGIVNTFIEHSYVDQVDTQSLLSLAESMQGMDAGRVSFLTIPTAGTTTDGSYNEIPRTDDINAIFDAIIDDQPLPGEADEETADGPKADRTASSSSSSSAAADTATTAPEPTATTATSVSPGTIGVRVLNGTGQTGVAADLGEQLGPLGFDVRGLADASQNQDTTVVRYGPGEKAAAATLASILPGATIQLDRTVKSGVEIIIGSDFAGSTSGSVPTAGTSLSISELPAAISSTNLPNDLAITNAGDTTCD